MTPRDRQISESLVWATSGFGNAGEDSGSEDSIRPEAVSGLCTRGRQMREGTSGLLGSYLLYFRRW